MKRLVNVSTFQWISAFQWGIGCHLLSLFLWQEVVGGSRLHSWLQFAGARVGNNDFVLCKSGLCVLSADAAFDHRGASTKSGSHCFNPHRLKQFLGDLKKQYFFSLLGVRHLRKSLLGHWLTTEITEEKRQILHTTRNMYFVKKKKKVYKSHK